MEAERVLTATIRDLERRFQTLWVTWPGGYELYGEDKQTVASVGWFLNIGLPIISRLEIRGVNLKF